MDLATMDRMQDAREAGIEAKGFRRGLQAAIMECEKAAEGMTDPGKAALLAFLVGRLNHIRQGGGQ